MSSWFLLAIGAVVLGVGVKLVLPKTVKSADALDPNPTYQEWGGDRLAIGVAFILLGPAAMFYGARALGLIDWLKSQY